MDIARRLVIASLLLLTTIIGTSPATAAPEEQLTWGVHISLAPTWFDPAQTSGIITPFMVLYAQHDSLVKAMPGNGMAPSLAESWSVSPEGLVYEFVLRKGVKFQRPRREHRERRARCRVMSGSGTSLDNLVRAQAQRGRDREAQGIGGPEIDQELELRGLFDGEVSRFRAFQDLVHVRSGAPVQI